VIVAVTVMRVQKNKDPLGVVKNDGGKSPFWPHACCNGAFLVCLKVTMDAFFRICKAF
jgi:hypothetical protein